jgi:hypothetical protein
LPSDPGYMYKVRAFKTSVAYKLTTICHNPEDHNVRYQDFPLLYHQTENTSYSGSVHKAPFSVSIFETKAVPITEMFVPLS